MEIVAQNLGKQYQDGFDALSQVTLVMERGTVNGLLGPNGAGKTTFLRMCATLEQPTAGTLMVLDRNVSDRHSQRQIRSHLGYLPQEFQLYTELKCEEFLAYVATLKGIGARSVRREIQRVLGEVNLLNAARRRIGALSGGMKQRIGIAQALLGQPKILILDEPTAGLDPQERARLRNLLLNLMNRCLIVLSTHMVEDAAQMCSSIFVLRNGQLAFEGSPEELASKPKGFVWEVETKAEIVLAGAKILGSVAVKNGTRYRILANTKPYPNARLVSVPTLEDGYIFLDESDESKFQET